MSTLTRILMLLVAVTGACGATHVEAGGERAMRGVVDADGPSVRAVTAGPVVIHAFSEFRGGAMFTAPATTGTDADCATAHAGRSVHEEPIAPDRRLVVVAAAGETVCLATSTTTRFELLWHAVRAPREQASDPMVAARTSPDGRRADSSAPASRAGAP
jgi:hypothetical protein